MPRAKKTDKFFVFNASKRGYCKGKMLLGVNHRYEGGTDNINLQDLIDFLEEQNIKPSAVKIYSSFTSYATE